MARIITWQIACQGCGTVRGVAAETWQEIDKLIAAFEPEDCCTVPRWQVQGSIAYDEPQEALPLPYPPRLHPMECNRYMMAGEHAVSPERAFKAGEDPALHAAVCFLRSDGWSLAASHEMMEVAFRTWPDEWTAFSTANKNWELREMGEYTGPQ